MVRFTEHLHQNVSPEPLLTREVPQAVRIRSVVHMGGFVDKYRHRGAEALLQPVRPSISLVHAHPYAAYGPRPYARPMEFLAGTGTPIRASVPFSKEVAIVHLRIWPEAFCDQNDPSHFGRESFDTIQRHVDALTLFSVQVEAVLV